MAGALLMGAVAYDPKVVTIWDGFRAWFRSHGLAFDYLLYSHYERQVEDLIAGHLHVAWNSPLAWLRSERLALASGRTVRPLAMRNTDRDLTSVIVGRRDAGIRTAEELGGRTVATGATDSPQATLLPMAHLAGLGVTVTARCFDVGVGLHGDHVGGERDAARALMAGEVDAAAMLDATYLLLGKEGTLPAGTTEVVEQTPPYDHCVMTAVDTAPADLIDRFTGLLLGMSYQDPEVRPLLDMEGLIAWEKGRTEGYRLLAAAVDRFHFYGPGGEVTMPGYEP